MRVDQLSLPGAGERRRREKVLLKSEQPSPLTHPHPSSSSCCSYLSVLAPSGRHLQPFLRRDEANHVVKPRSKRSRSPGQSQQPRPGGAGGAAGTGAGAGGGAGGGRASFSTEIKKKGKNGEEEEPGRERAGVREGDPVPHPDLPVEADQVGVGVREQVFVCHRRGGNNRLKKTKNAWKNLNAGRHTCEALSHQEGEEER